MNRRTCVLATILLCLMGTGCFDTGEEAGENDRDSSFKSPPAKIDLTDAVWDGHAIAYSGFRQGQRPGGIYPTDAEILEDLLLLERNWSLIRVYNSDLHGEAVLRVIDLHRLELQVLLGIYLFQTRGLTGEVFATNEALNQNFIREGLRLARTYPDLVAGISVGNETLVSWSGVANAPRTIIGYVRQVRSGLQADDLDIPVTVADNHAYWKSPESTVVAAELDFVVVHVDAVWDGRKIEEAVDYLRENVEEVRTNLAGKRIVVAGTGWATYAEDAHIYGKIGPAANEVNQRVYFQRLSDWARSTGTTTFFFEAFDEPWKGEGDSRTVEVHWGLFDAHRRPKLAMHEFYGELVAEKPTSPSYEGFVFNPVTAVAPAFRGTVAQELGIDARIRSMSTCSVIESADAREGGASLLFNHHGKDAGGFVAHFADPLDLSGKQTVQLALAGIPAAARYLEMKFEGGGASAVNLLAYAAEEHDGWSLYSIPLADFALVDFSRIDAVGFWHPFSYPAHDRSRGEYVAARILIDDIHFQ